MEAIYRPLGTNVQIGVKVPESVAITDDALRGCQGKKGVRS